MEPGTEQQDVDQWDCFCKRCNDSVRVWLKELLAVAFTPQTLQESINECLTTDQRDRPYLDMGNLATSLRERVKFENPCDMSRRLEIALDADKIEDLLRDEFTDLKWVASHLQDWLEQELMEEAS